jgi:hypothetical protein
LDAGEDIADYADWDKATKPGLEIKRLNVDLPLHVIEKLDRAARLRGITRQALIKVFLFDAVSYYNLTKAGIGLGPIMRWFYDKFHPLWRPSSFPRRTGRIPVGEPTPSRAINLQPGELVRVRSHKEILQTLNPESKNRELLFDGEMVPFCGKTYRVLQLPGLAKRGL